MPSYPKQLLHNFKPGMRVRHGITGRQSVIVELLPFGNARLRYSNGRTGKTTKWGLYWYLPVPEITPQEIEEATFEAFAGRAS